MDIFWCDIKYVVNVNLLLKVKKVVLEGFDEDLPFFKFKYDFDAFCYSKSPDSENLYSLLVKDKVSGVFRTSSSSQPSQDGCAVCDFVKSEEGENDIISSWYTLIVVVGMRSWYIYIARHIFSGHYWRKNFWPLSVSKHKSLICGLWTSNHFSQILLYFKLKTPMNRPKLV